MSWHRVLSLAFLFWAAELFASWRNLSKTGIEQLDGEAEEQRKQKEKEGGFGKAFFFSFGARCVQSTQSSGLRFSSVPGA